MGLDVYLYRCPDRDTARAVEEEYNRETEKIWEAACHGKQHDQITEAERKEYLAQTAAARKRLGLDDSGERPNAKKIEINSSKYPGHMFKIGYLRSSYNDSGVNQYLRRMGLMDLYGVFDQENGDRYEFAPDWKAAKENIKRLLADYDARSTEPIAQFDCMDTRQMAYEGAPKSAKEALALFEKEMQKWKRGKSGMFESYSNRAGFFAKKAMPVHAIIGGTSYGTQTTYVVYKREPSEDGDFYRQALEITEEMIDYVLAQPEQENYYLHWSA